MISLRCEYATHTLQHASVQAETRVPAGRTHEIGAPGVGVTLARVHHPMRLFWRGWPKPPPWLPPYCILARGLSRNAGVRRGRAEEVIRATSRDAFSKKRKTNEPERTSSAAVKHDRRKMFRRTHRSLAAPEPVNHRSHAKTSLAASRSATRPSRPSPRARARVGACASRRAAAACLGAPRRASAPRAPARRARAGPAAGPPPRGVRGRASRGEPRGGFPPGAGGGGPVADARRARRARLRGRAPRRDAACRGASLFLLLGPNGCGKSTLAVLRGAQRARAGRLRVQAPRAFVFQNPDHQVVMPTVGADVAFGLGNRRDLSDDDVAAAVRDALAAVNLGGARRGGAPGGDALGRAEALSLAIAGALVEKPQVLLLDELTTFLDEADQCVGHAAWRSSDAAYAARRREEFAAPRIRGDRHAPPSAAIPCVRTNSAERHLTGVNLMAAYMEDGRHNAARLRSGTSSAGTSGSSRGAARKHLGIALGVQAAARARGDGGGGGDGSPGAPWRRARVLGVGRGRTGVRGSLQVA